MRDAEIKRALRAGPLRAYRDDPETRIVEELGLFQGFSRIDVAVINGSLHGFEIKSECDSLRRLPNQIAAYGAIFDTLTAVVSPKHLRGVVRLLPPWWGVLVVRASGSPQACPQWECVRSAVQNQTADITALVQLLWRDEAAGLLVAHGVKPSSLVFKPRRLLWKELCSAVPETELRAEIRTMLKVRPHWRADAPPG